MSAPEGGPMRRTTGRRRPSGSTVRRLTSSIQLAGEMLLFEVLSSPRPLFMPTMIAAGSRLGKGWAVGRRTPDPLLGRRRRSADAAGRFSAENSQPQNAHRQRRTVEPTDRAGSLFTSIRRGSQWCFGESCASRLYRPAATGHASPVHLVGLNPRYHATARCPRTGGSIRDRRNGREAGDPLHRCPGRPGRPGHRGPVEDSDFPRKILHHPRTLPGTTASGAPNFPRKILHADRGSPPADPSRYGEVGQARRLPLGCHGCVVAGASTRAQLRDLAPLPRWCQPSIRRAVSRSWSSRCRWAGKQVPYSRSSRRSLVAQCSSCGRRSDG